MSVMFSYYTIYVFLSCECSRIIPPIVIAFMRDTSTTCKPSLCLSINGVNIHRSLLYMITEPSSLMSPWHFAEISEARLGQPVVLLPGAFVNLLRRSEMWTCELPSECVGMSNLDARRLIDGRTSIIEDFHFNIENREYYLHSN